MPGLARKPLTKPNPNSDPRLRRVTEPVHDGAAKTKARVLPMTRRAGTPSVNDPRFSAVLSAETRVARPATAEAESRPGAAAMIGVFGGSNVGEHTPTVQPDAAAPSNADVPVTPQPPPQAQSSGSSRVLNYLAGRANSIPGFRMFTIVLGVNPINMSRVERSAVNILRAVVELLPGGALITEALDNHGVFGRVGNWVEPQIRTLGMTGSVIRQAIDRFLGSLSWRDIFNPGGVWQRARRIFTEPIDRIVSFARGLVTGILRLIKEAILRPLARLAEGTRGYGLLKAVLGEDPVTGDPVPRNAETLIGGFMRLINQEEIWQNIQRSNAVARAWAWFQGALSGLMGFVRQIPALFVQAFRSLEIADIILVPRAFARIASVFGGFIGNFLSWAGNTVWNLLEIIFSVVAPSVMVYLRRAAGAFRTILRNPIGFVGNLVRAGLLGLRQFAAHFLTHLRASLIGWLTGAMSGANIYIPQGLNLREILKFVLSVLGLTWQNIRGKLVRAIGETAVRVLETGFDLVVTLVTEGPAAAWQKILESLSSLREMVMEQIMTFVRERVVQAAITRLVTSLNPAGAFIQAIIAIYNTVMFFVERLRQIAQVAAAFIDSIAAIASGSLSAAANRVEQTMAGLLTLVISFLARIAGLGRVSDAVTNIINRVRQPIDRALDRVVDWIVATARRLGRFIVQAGVPQDPNERLRLALATAATAVRRLPEDRVGRAIITPILPAIRLRYGLTTLQAEIRGGTWWLDGAVNPRSSLSSGKAASTSDSPSGSVDPTRVKADVAAEAQRLPRIMGSPEELMGTLRGIFARHEPRGLKRLFVQRTDAGFDLLAEASAAAFSEHLTGLTRDGAGGCSILMQVDGRVVLSGEGIGLVVWNAGGGGPHAEARLHSKLPVLRRHLRRSSDLIEIWIRYSPCNDRCGFVLDAIEREIKRDFQLVRFRWYYEELWQGDQTRAIALEVVRAYRRRGIMIMSRAGALASEELRSRRS